jgi:hypothetical protein
MMASTTRGRGFKTMLQELFECALIFAGAGPLYEGFRSMGSEEIEKRVRK